MDLKFSFGASNPLPLSSRGAGSASTEMLGTGSSVLELQVTLGDSELVCEGVSSDGGSYATAHKSVTDDDPASIAAALRSVLARGGAELPEPLLTTVSAVVIDLGGREAAVLEHLGLVVSPGTHLLAQVDAALQARTGISAGTPIQVA